MAAEGEVIALAKRPGDLLLVLFFIIHLPIMLLLDAQTIFPKDWFPTRARTLVEWHVNTNGDYLLREVPPFFRALAMCEIFIQLPLHIALAYAFLKGKQWGRMAGIIYGVHTATTMPPILGDILASKVPTRNVLFAIYFPYLLIPLVVIARLLPYARPFAPPSMDSIDSTKKKTT